MVASYDFDDQTLNNSKSEGDVAQAIVTGLNNYTGTVTYGEGRNGGKAVKLGDYGLKLNKQNLGDNFTVSLWLKAEGRIANNQSVMFLGYHNPEKWYAIAGRDSNNGVKMWANGGIYGWTEFGTLPLANDWHSVVITGDSENITTYFGRGSRYIRRDKSSVGRNKPGHLPWCYILGSRIYGLLWMM